MLRVAIHNVSPGQAHNVNPSGPNRALRCRTDGAY